jgi:hypothetical protein
VLTVLNVTSPEKVTSLFIILVGVGDRVGVGVGVEDTLNKETSTSNIPQANVGVTVFVGVNVGVAVTEGVINDTGSHSKYELKSNTEQLFVGVGVGVGHVPEDK